jgi:hypothetical protein
MIMDLRLWVNSIYYFWAISMFPIDGSGYMGVKWKLDI